MTTKSIWNLISLAVKTLKILCRICLLLSFIAPYILPTPLNLFGSDDMASVLRSIPVRRKMKFLPFFFLHAGPPPKPALTPEFPGGLSLLWTSKSVVHINMIRHCPHGQLVSSNSHLSPPALKRGGLWDEGRGPSCFVSLTVPPGGRRFLNTSSLTKPCLPA